MVKVAIAGGTTGVGKAIANAIDTQSPHEHVILSRKSSQDPNTIVADYSNVESLQAILEAHGIHTVISALSIRSDECGQAQMNLIEAAKLSSSTKRLIPSEFGIIYKPEHLKSLPTYEWKFKAIEGLEASTLEYTLFSIGTFMDYWFAPRIQSPLTSVMSPFVDLESNLATIPGDGNIPFVATHTRDVGRFVTALLDLPHWEKRYQLIGDRLTLNDFVRMAEEVKGTTFKKNFDSLEMLSRGECTLSPAIEKGILSFSPDIKPFMGMIATTGERLAKGDNDLDPEKSLNRVFPEIQTLTFRDAIEIWIKGGKE